MLALTGQAVEAIRTLTTQPGTPESTGLRIAPQAGDASSLGLTLAQQPHQGDEVIESGGVRVFVEEQAAVLLDDKALDAIVGDAGEVSFTLARQEM